MTVLVKPLEIQIQGFSSCDIERSTQLVLVFKQGISDKLHSIRSDLSFCHQLVIVDTAKLWKSLGKVQVSLAD
ncbi:hypothetical protein SAMD00079811_65650 [Scytonema sp. HK-05]|nr:hypothetical protein SAMD00079811_65650 [Scytonema sp. HK-05]